MNTHLRIAGIINESIVDGPGIRLVVFTQGCKHNCPGCHNPETHPFEKGNLVEVDDIIKQMKSNPLLDGITLSGGDPFEQAEALSELAKRVKNIGHNVITYTGYTFEYILENKDTNKGWDKLINETDILVDGRFEIAKKTMLLKFRGSANQRIIDVKKSLASHSIVEIQL
ncbi:MAG: nrdG [Clostridiales bacterium]|jgi:anaerobic ribonucleoside-triphosphate reductase activating protein|nr:nrdG [Clostridiales bacterium]